ncbi:NYN domain-containing protein [Marinobacterium rhizophilum]|uniref:NYN domain-containing protein n=1 Tax=Marinobacterium rhizophilum TaxID=420402 RepID=A0ABY5HE70_9GAMM|nr:NYN domain-containing protein [Marinobacterium rhizophilum]UTW10648.1 NYN domain-containing protein [Marinobacterium rhizophilum]
MKDLDQHKKIAVLVDADNAQRSKTKHILDELSGHGHIVVKRAYGDWSSENLKNWRTTLNELAIQPCQQFAYTTGKNSTDGAMIIDAMDLLYSKRFDAFAIVSSDSDFTSLASRLKQSEIYVFGFGEKKTPISFRNACDDFIFTEILGDAPAQTLPGNPDLEQIRRLLIKAWREHSDDEGWMNMGHAGSLLKRQRPDFDPRTFGASSFKEFLQLLAPQINVEQKQRGNGRPYMYQVAST